MRPIIAHMRWMVYRDFAEVLDIERVSQPDPWNEETLRNHCRQRNTIGMVAEFGGEVIGYMLYELHRERVDLLRLAVAPEFRRRTIGWQMVARLRSKLGDSRRTRLVYVVHERDLDRQLFLRAVGVQAVATRRGYFTPADGYEFELVREAAADGADVDRVLIVGE